MSRLTELLRQARKADEQLGADLEAEIATLLKRRTFGLVFERHVPEAVELPGRSVRRGDKVRVLPSRGETWAGDQRLWRVERVQRVDGAREAHVWELDAEEPETQVVAVDDVVVVAEFKDRLYPGLVETGRVERGGDKPFHTVINAENFHALQMLTYTHRGRVDAIYIDPPYNSGAKDWKYNNDYVEGDDDYRHSKWLAFMERRLNIAQELLDPDDSVLIVTIDEKEVHRLALLLEQMFPDAGIQMVSSQINPANVARRGGFGRNDEYLFFVMIGKAFPQRVRLGDDWVSGKGRTFTGKVRWDLLRRSGTNAQRSDRPRLFYPILVDPGSKRVVGAGPHLSAEQTPDDYRPDNTDLIPVWPIRKDGSQGNWQLGQAALMEHVDQGRVRLGGSADKGYVVYYIKGGEYEKILRGDYPLHGRNPDGSLNVGHSSSDGNLVVPGTQWKIASHDATQYGSRLLLLLLPGRPFPFPKSLYAVEDALRFFVNDKPEAVILDFFSGSGSTAHAVMRLNHQDRGRRQCISVTNNEVSANEQKALRAKGLRSGDPEWEQWGISDYVTKPRICAAITGNTPEGRPIKGAYKFVDEFPMAEGFEENAAFFTLTYEAPLPVRHHRAFDRIAPMLWMRAGAQGRMITDLGEHGWDVANTYGVLENLDRAADFVARVVETNTVRTVFVVTDDESAFQMVSRDLPSRVVPVQLYESYLHNFEIDTARSH